jgi:multidrug resistance efflux pump
MIAAAHDAAARAAYVSIEKAIEAGEALIEAKELLGHGEWLPWLGGVEMSARTAQRYMRLARHKDAVLDTQKRHATDLSLREALALLDTRTELERALALQGHQDALRAQIDDLAEAVEQADLEELQWIIAEVEDLRRQASENQLRAKCELGRLLSEIDVARKRAETSGFPGR